MKQPQSIIFFDGECNLCNGFVRFVLLHEASKYYKFTSLQSNFTKQFFIKNNFNSQSIDSVIVFENNQFYTESIAAFRIINNLKWPYKLLICFNIFPLFIKQYSYQFIAKHRHKIFGKSNECWVMQPQFKDRFL